MNSTANQVAALRQKAGLLVDFPRCLLSVTGKEAVSFLHNIVSHDIKGLPVGQGQPACLLNRQGKIRSAFIVHRQAKELLLEMPPELLTPTLEALRQHVVSEAVEFLDATSRYRIIGLHGPLAAQILDGVEKPGLLWVERWDLFRVPGYQLWVSPESEAGVREHLKKIGRPLGLEDIGPEAFEILRIEAGVPWPGKEMEETVILNELGTEDWMSFAKGCYVGQEIVARIKYRAHPPRLLTGFFIEGNNPPPSRSPILLGLETAGSVTSSCFSPTLNRVIALGFLQFGLSDEKYLIQTPSGNLPAQKTDLPFIRPL